MFAPQNARGELVADLVVNERLSAILTLPNASITRTGMPCTLPRRTSSSIAPSIRSSP